MRKYDELEIIKSIKDDGDLTQEEYEIEKKKILDRPDDVTIGGIPIYALCCILGICSIFFGAMGVIKIASVYFSIVLGVTAIILSFVSKKKSNGEKNSKMAITGMITGIFGILISIAIIIMIIYSVVRLYNVPSTYNNEINNTTNNELQTNSTDDVTSENANVE